jgi:hypothetical protein
MRSILLLFILALTFNVYAGPLGKKKCKTKTKEVSCKIYKGKKKPSKGLKIFSGGIPIGMITLSAMLASKQKRTGQ